MAVLTASDTHSLRGAPLSVTTTRAHGVGTGVGRDLTPPTMQQRRLAEGHSQQTEASPAMTAAARWSPRADGRRPGRRCTQCPAGTATWPHLTLVQPASVVKPSHGVGCKKRTTSRHEHSARTPGVHSTHPAHKPCGRKLPRPSAAPQVRRPGHTCDPYTYNEPLGLFGTSPLPS